MGPRLRAQASRAVLRTDARRKGARRRPTRRVRWVAVPRLASIYPLVTARALARPFTYEVPEEVDRGAIVEMRLGRARQRGVVTEVGVDAPAGVETAAVERVVGAVPPALV